MFRSSPALTHFHCMCLQVWHRHRFRKRGRSLCDQAMESYLREDVPCGFPACNVCKSTLPRLPTESSHIVIPDHNVVGNYLEVFQLPEMQSVVYLTSCIKQVYCTDSKRRLFQPKNDASGFAVRQVHTWQVLSKGNLRKGTKIRTLYSDIRRQCVLFDDTHCVWTAGQPSER